MKLCECGCGNPAPIAKYNDKRRGHIIGQPIRFVWGHNSMKGEKSIHWKGGTRIHENGYVYVIRPKGRHQKRSRVVAEKALGGKLPSKAVVHHFDEDKANDANNNLVICENQKYHFLLHARKKALDAKNICAKFLGVKPETLEAEAKKES